MNCSYLKKGSIERMQDILFNKKLLPDFHEYIEKVSYLDGCKVHFRNGE